MRRTRMVMDTLRRVARRRWRICWESEDGCQILFRSSCRVGACYIRTIGPVNLQARVGRKNRWECCDTSRHDTCLGEIVPWTALRSVPVVVGFN